MFTDNDRGQVGIGTLIVFIAMVLVAAIAAGVLINTAGLLQSQAEATGEESAEQVSDRVVIQSVSAEVDDASPDELGDIELIVRRSPGAGDINLNNLIIEAFADGESKTYTEDGGGDEYDVEEIGDFDTDDTLTDSADRAEITFSPPGNINAGESISISVTTSAGGTAFVEKRAPSTLDSDDEQIRL